MALVPWPAGCVLANGQGPHTFCGPRRHPCLSEGRGRRIFFQGRGDHLKQSHSQINPNDFHGPGNKSGTPNLVGLQKNVWNVFFAKSHISKTEKADPPSLTWEPLGFKRLKIQIPLVSRGNLNMFLPLNQHPSTPIPQLTRFGRLNELIQIWCLTQVRILHL